MFVALGKRDHVAFALIRRLKLHNVLTVPASTIAEFWRSQRGFGETRFGLLKPTVVPVDESLAKRAGELLKRAGGRDAMDAIIVALAERTGARRIYTSDVADIERLLGVATDWGCEVVAV